MLYPQGHVLDDASQYQLSWIIQVTEHSEAPADGRFEGWGRYQTQDITVSADGIHWRKLGCPGLPSGDEANLSHDRQAGIFIATLKVGEMTRYCRSISLATSHDFEHWTKPELVFHTDDEDQESARTIIAEHLANDSLCRPAHNVPAEYMADVYNMGVFRYEGLYVGMPEIFYHTGNVNYNSDGFKHVQLAMSRDLRNWVRLGGRQPIILPSTVASGAYDRAQIGSSSSPVLVGDELWFYYNGHKYRCTPPDAEPNQGAVCLATLRRDGFISLDAGKEEGTLLTEPFILKSPWLYVNVDATGGSFQAELLDEGGHRVTMSETESGDHMRLQVQWRDAAEDLLHRAVRLRFSLRKASLYSYWFDERPEVPGR